MKKSVSFLFSLLLLATLWVNVIPVLAANSITINPVWRPPTQLTTIDTDADGITDVGDDIRYVTVDIYATANVEFWGVGFVCTVNKNVLESYIQNSDPNSTEDNVAMFTKSNDWLSSSWSQTTNTVDADGKFSFAITITGSTSSPLGGNGISETVLIATLKFRVKEGLATSTSSPFTCTSNFLNRDGKTVVASRYSAPPPLNVLTGYTLTGKVNYQAITARPTVSQAIDIACDGNSDGIFDDVVTTANVTTGLFTVNNLRTQGRYDCLFVGNMLSPGIGADLHLMASTDFNFTNGSFALLPIILRSGNVDRTGASIGDIDTQDFNMITSNWNAPLSVLTAPYMLGDANGDRKINESDLLIASLNANQFETVYDQHLIYSLPRNASSFQNSRIWIGSIHDANPNQFVAGNSRDYWPAVSTDGARIAFVRNVGTGTNDKYALFTAPITNGVVGAATRISPATATYDAFAPSWSPDGSLLAFICSYNQDWKGTSGTSGNICLIGPNGLNFQIVNSGIGSNFSSRIQPPAWINKTMLYFAGSDNSGWSSCDTSICAVDIVSNSALSFLPHGADWPVVRTNSFGTVLYYRFDNGAGSRTIRFVNINPISGFNSAFYPDTTSPNFHTEVSDGSIISTTVAYFTVSTGADPNVFYYENNPSTNDQGGEYFQIVDFDGTATAPSWYEWFWGYYRITDGVRNPDFASGYYDALINTVAYLP